MVCNDSKEIEWNELEEILSNKAIIQQLPTSVTLELTYRCNLSCIHCYVCYHNCSNDHHDTYNPNLELNTNGVFKLLDKLEKFGIFHITLTGGDPLIREDFEEIYLYAKKKGFLITLFTNGILLNDHYKSLLSEFPPKNVEISIYGMTEKVHESITKCPGSYKLTFEAIDWFLKEGFNLHLKTVVLTINNHELNQMKEFAKKNMVPFRYTAIIYPHLLGSKEIYPYRLPIQEIVNYDIEDNERRQGWNNILNEKKNQTDNRMGFLYNCKVLTNSFHINPFGIMSACHLSRKPNYDLVNGSVKEGWEYLLSLREIRFDPSNKCARCKIYSICNQCPGWNQLERKADDDIIECLCKIAHLRAESFGISNGSIN